MALDINNFYQHTTPTYIDPTSGIAMVVNYSSYVSLVDNLATIKASGYFSGAATNKKLRPGDLINVIAADGFALLRYLAGGTVRTFTEA